MKSLVWRYVTSEQSKNEQAPVTEDDVNELKQQITSFRYDLLDVLKDNGMKINKVQRKRAEVDALAESIDSFGQNTLLLILLSLLSYTANTRKKFMPADSWLQAELGALLKKVIHNWWYRDSLQKAIPNKKVRVRERRLLKDFSITLMDASDPDLLSRHSSSADVSRHEAEETESRPHYSRVLQRWRDLVKALQVSPIGTSKNLTAPTRTSVLRETLEHQVSTEIEDAPLPTVREDEQAANETPLVGSVQEAAANNGWL
ncbi:hypothetical protein HPB52_022357 [Rhipicephalus sanguineus]|uniref:Uncharacterized protein n=1 Tax=Rhipicephalus sanguineus TaxID=34632 RepID=A0A9D4Q8K9_RHISA|nr:hypothetical protein HPB52_022357 [Rhipicephalus sanguineus]